MQMGFLASPWSLVSHFLTLHLLQLGSADFRVVGPSRPLLATVGQDVVLPCHLSPRMDARSLEIRWIRHQLSETVHLYRNGEDLHKAQMEEYIGRTELARDGLSGGSLDLQISELRPSDDGQYVCTVQDAGTYAEAMVELEVAALGSVPLLSLEAYEDGGIRVVCRSAGWYPSPHVLWKDDNGQHLPSVSQRHSPDERGLFEIQDVVIVRGKENGNVSCVVRNNRLEQEQVSILHISAPFFHNARPWMAALGVFLLLSVICFGVIAYLFRRKEQQKAALDMVTLDPNTAHPELVLSEDLRSVKRGPACQNLTDHPKRFSYWRCVLGQERFWEGRYCWEVEVKEEVGGDSWWGVGVANESVERKRVFNLSPEEGIWAVDGYEGQFRALTSPRTVLSLSPVPRRICVCLDCTQGLVMFLNADTGGEIFSFPPASFHGETLRPWFWVETWKTQLCLRGSTRETLSPTSIPTTASSRPCPSPETPHSPLLDPAGDVPLCPVPAQGPEGD
ncbi:PREDICTED: butyrophilin subfamily 3 member A2-like [Calidris pugnax]|uniref:butyrophilin subfamily 3 member A2-like n=1 Tax=Calidris pugnax TaxID=198806 RepID=UPI00071E2075|nr:PREDICTED: butyrophilin subfamily 3 member A2-like [Calidris pugnax]